MIGADDHARVAELLGREPNGAFDVVLRHFDGSPLVIANDPFLDDGTPMPTRFWLVGEPERTWIGRLESTGAIDRVEATIGDEPIAAAHRRYSALRDSLISPDHVGPRPSGGVGGTRVGVKCLHAHYAWYLVGGDDPVGRWVADRLAELGHVASVSSPVSHSSAGTSPAPMVPIGPTPSPDSHARVVAAIDCGTNSTRCLVARRGPTGGIESIDRRMVITRLGRGVDATGRLSPDAIDRTVDVLRGFRAIFERHGVEAVRATATSAARDASNSNVFFDAAESVLGVRPELIAGTEEGALSFAGATADLGAADGPFLVVDIGGGSTEFVAGSIDVSSGPHLSGVESLDVGCVRVTERFLHGDPPAADEIATATVEVDRLVHGVLDRVKGARAARTLVGLAGTVSTLASIDLVLASYDRDRVHHHVLARATVEDVTDRFETMSVEDRRKVPGMEPQRADVMLGGLIVLRSIVRATSAATVLVSESDILDGLAASLLN